MRVQGLVLGKKAPLFPEFSVSLPPEVERGDSGTTLRALIARIVRREVEAFDERQAERPVVRALTAGRIAMGLEKGRIVTERCDVPAVAVDAESAVATACQAFEDGLYLVFVDDVRQKELDAQVFLAPDSRVTFLRLTLLAGG